MKPKIASETMNTYEAYIHFAIERINMPFSHNLVQYNWQYLTVFAAAVL